MGSVILLAWVCLHRRPPPPTRLQMAGGCRLRLHIALSNPVPVAAPHPRPPRPGPAPLPPVDTQQDAAGTFAAIASAYLSLTDAGSQGAELFRCTGAGPGEGWARLGVGRHPGHSVAQ